MENDQETSNRSKGSQYRDLYGLAARGSAWIFSLRITEAVLATAKVIILARLLQPTDFGLMGIALLTLSFLETFSNLGFREALIQRKDDIETYLDTAWTITIIRGVVIFGVMLLIAPYAATFFKYPGATNIIRVIGFSELLLALTNVGVVYFQKELDFKKHAYLEVSGYIADFTVAVVFGIIYRSVWALVLGLLASRFTVCILSYFIHPYKPRLNLLKEEARQLWFFGKWLTGSSVLVFLITQGDDILVGRMLGTEMLGYYQIAYKVSNTPATQMTHVLSRVTLPTYSKLQQDLPRLRNALYFIYLITAYASMFIAGIIIAVSYDFTAVILGKKWMPIVPALCILAGWGVIRSLVGTLSPIFMAVGKPKLLTYYQLIQVIIMYAMLVPFILLWGIEGASLAVLLAAVLLFFIRNRALINILDLDVKRFYWSFFLPLLITAVSTLAALSVRQVIPAEQSLIRLAVEAIIFCSICLMLHYIYNRYVWKWFKTEVRLSVMELLRYFKA
jgi:lipopolysaccharide exporter